MELYDAATWDDRFDILDREIAARTAAGRAPRDEVLWLWNRIVGCQGCVTMRLADLAADCGYYDQAHFDRDFRAFAGITPSDLVRSLRIDGGFAAD
jgi:AraC-like DNA-binding protein